MKCYGNYAPDQKECSGCLWGESCAFYTQSAKEISRVGKKMVSIDYFSNIAAPVQSQEGEDTTVTTGEIADFLKWLLDVDDYTLGILRELILSSAPLSVSELAKIHGCTRGAMHQKILNIISNDYRLAPLFLATMPKISRARKRFLRNH